MASSFGNNGRVRVENGYAVKFKTSGNLIKQKLSYGGCAN
jgi:hypothetical protein